VDPDSNGAPEGGQSAGSRRAATEPPRCSAVAIGWGFNLRNVEAPGVRFGVLRLRKIIPRSGQKRSVTAPLQR
jgi:hypothetical protein